MPSIGISPVNNILLVENNTIIELNAGQISIDKVGEKAFGLSCIPRQWTLPFLVVSQDLTKEARAHQPSELAGLVSKWIDRIIVALDSLNLNNESQLILRSSGTNESIVNRGQFHTKRARSNRISNDIVSWLTDIISDESLSLENINLIIQKYSITSAKGHLSNERRCSKEARDWLGEIENENASFKINLRKWRRIEYKESDIPKPLECNIKVSLQHVLKKAAAWGGSHNCRLHFEWTWDGKCIYLVQVDTETPTGSFDPVKSVSSTSKNLATFLPKVLSKISSDHGKKYHKIHNVLTYTQLGLPTTDLYVLDSKVIISELSRGIINPKLSYDIKNLVKSSLVIRTDIVTSVLADKQLLPRTHEVRTFDEAKKWLIDQSGILLQKLSPTVEIAFIFHNFIPAEAAAFAFSAPGERKVQIESLWGIPEGLYYNSHDKFTVDTKHSKIESISSIDSYDFITKQNYKRNCVAPDSNGSWVNQIVSDPYDWSRSIRKTEWIKKIAHDSRLISDREDKPLSIMWFVGVPKVVSSALIVPWYHEVYELDKIPRSQKHRKKTPFDKIFEIRNTADITALKKAISGGDTSIRKVLVKPQEEVLLRDRDILTTIGDLVKQIDAVIYLEGATLSHAYYQLIQTGACVEASHAFKDEEEKREFNKLVRDKIPQKIEQAGELVNAEKLSGEDLLRALCEKLVEESFEVLDAKDHDSVIEELSDVLEVIDGILSSLKTDMSEVVKAKEKKLSKVGGFKDGVVLVRTANPAPSTKYGSSSTQDLLPLDIAQGQYNYSKYRSSDSARLNKWTDKREHAAAKETLLKVSAPVTLDSWKSETPQLSVGDETISAEVSLERKNGEIEVSVSVFSKQVQLNLL